MDGGWTKTHALVFGIGTLFRAEAHHTWNPKAESSLTRTDFCSDTQEAERSFSAEARGPRLANLAGNTDRLPSVSVKQLTACPMCPRLGSRERAPSSSSSLLSFLLILQTFSSLLSHLVQMVRLYGALSLPICWLRRDSGSDGS